MEVIYEYNIDKDALLQEQRGISFEEVINILRAGNNLLDIIEHPNKTKYGRQKIYVVKINNYVYLVPFVETVKGVFLKTIFPSRKLTKQYLNHE